MALRQEISNLGGKPDAALPHLDQEDCAQGYGRDADHPPAREALFQKYHRDSHSKQNRSLAQRRQAGRGAEAKRQHRATIADNAQQAGNQTRLPLLCNGLEKSPAEEQRDDSAHATAQHQEDPNDVAGRRRGGTHSLRVHHGIAGDAARRRNCPFQVGLLEGMANTDQKHAGADAGNAGDHEGIDRLVKQRYRTDCGQARRQAARDRIRHGHIRLFEGADQCVGVKQVQRPRGRQPSPRVRGQRHQQRSGRDEQRAETINQHPARHFVVTGLQDGVYDRVRSA
jgi:hypothetical protein